jgi:hypothetical protein
MGKTEQGFKNVSLDLYNANDILYFGLNNSI